LSYCCPFSLEGQETGNNLCGDFYQNHREFDSASEIKRVGNELHSTSDQLGRLGMGIASGTPSQLEDSIYREAILTALSLGIRRFDTAHNYRSGRSERVIGEVLSGFQEKHSHKIHISTKIGFVDAPDSLAGVAREKYLEQRYPHIWPSGHEDLALGQHSLHLNFLRHCLLTSKDRLKERMIDCLYIHNPETQLHTIESSELERKLHAVFAWLEGEIQSGVIESYGISTWQSLIVDPGTQYHLSLKRLTEIAREVAGDQHHLRAVMLPFSPGLDDGWTRPTQKLSAGILPAIQAAYELGLQIFTSAPFGQSKFDRFDPQDCQDLLAHTCSEPTICGVYAGMCRREHIISNVECVQAMSARSKGIDSWIHREN
jgi:hypothetical protein